MAGHPRQRLHHQRYGLELQRRLIVGSTRRPEEGMTDLYKLHVIPAMSSVAKMLSSDALPPISTVPFGWIVSAGKTS